MLCYEQQVGEVVFTRVTPSCHSPPLPFSFSIMLMHERCSFKMLLSTTMILSLSPIATHSSPTSTIVKLETFSLKNGGVIRIRGVAASSMAPRNRKVATCSVSASSDGNASVETDVPFPTDYSELLEQARVAVELAVKDNKQLMEIEFPTAGLASVPGDGEGGIEMTESMQLIQMLVVEELYKEAVLNTERKLIIFNGELDRIRSGYYPPFFYPKLAALTKSFLPVMETVYYIHNFKGRNGGTLFRCYPGPWKVLRRVGSSRYVCLHQQDTMPSLKEVALDILPST
ncbi:hypothetical protein SESBI_07362 [Sesbania bispinosa]|nr:hypothetical protein SESBI_07362 [Sesbania bispinosa]